ncbi:MAG: VWA domain-containing protein [Thermoanaerobaculaceae bacterium]|nr:VWA domain-containing protein [Thermoanaerobaculaceae bacterium]
MQALRVAALLGVGLLAAVGSYGQEKPAAAKPPEQQVGGLQFIDTSQVTIVNVDVSVMDKGEVVRGLGASDFELYQDGKLQEITNFAFISLTPAGGTRQPAATTGSEEGVTLAPPLEYRREPKFVAIYVDNENIQPFNRNRVLNRLEEWIQSHLLPPDQAMVVAYQRSLKVLQPFTSNTQLLLDALRPLRRYTGGRTSVDSERRRIEDAIKDAAQQASGGSSGAFDRILGEVRSFAREQRSDLVFTVGALQEFIGMMAGLPGKKVIMYVSDGLPMSPGLELYYAIQDQWRDVSLMTQAMEFDATPLFRSLVTSASAAGISFYTIDARGLESELGIEAENRTARSTMAAAALRSNLQDSLLYMAEQTGGMAIVNTNDVKPGLERIAQMFENYYWLGYRLEPSGKDRAHRIEVKVKGHPEYTVNFRRTFIEKTLPTQVGDRVVSGLVFDLDDNPLGVEVSAGEPAPAANGRWTLPVEVRVPIAKVALIPDGDQLVGYVMLYYAARDAEGKQSDLQRVEHTVRVPQAEYETAATKQFTFTASLLLEPGVYRISVGLRDQLTNQAGYATIKRAVHPEAS